MHNGSLYWYPWYVNDWLGSSARAMLTPIQQAGYRNLLDWQWQFDDGKLPVDAPFEALSGLGNQWNSNAIAILKHFMRDDEGRYYNEKLNSLWTQQNEAHEKRVNAGKLGGYSKHKHTSKASSNATVKLVASQNQNQNQNQKKNQKKNCTEPETNSDFSKKPDLEGGDTRFEQAWKDYGRYGVKKVAREYWKAYSTEETAEIIAAIPVYLQCVAAGRSKSQFEGWINPSKRKWDVDWGHALKDLTKDGKGNANQDWRKQENHI